MVLELSLVPGCSLRFRQLLGHSRNIWYPLLTKPSINLLRFGLCFGTLLSVSKCPFPYLSLQLFLAPVGPIGSWHAFPNQLCQRQSCPLGASFLSVRPYSCSVVRWAAAQRIESSLWILILGLPNYRFSLFRLRVPAWALDEAALAALRHFWAVQSLLDTNLRQIVSHLCAAPFTIASQHYGFPSRTLVQQHEQHLFQTDASSFPIAPDVPVFLFSVPSLHVSALPFHFAFL